MKVSLLCLVAILSATLGAQVKSVSTIALPWVSVETVNYSGKSYEFPRLIDEMVDPINGLPLYECKIPINGLEDIYDVKVVGVADSSIHPSKSVDFRKLAGGLTEFNVSWSVINEAGKRSLLIICNPLFINKSGEIRYYNFIDIAYNLKAGGGLKLANNIFVENSVLSKGRWVKISITESGVYQLDYSKLASWGFLNPTKVRVFGNGGAMLPNSNSAAREDDLAEIPLYDNGKALLFYGQGVVSWSFNQTYNMYLHSQNLYDRNSYYFITESDQPRKIISNLPTELSYDTISTTYIGYDYHESNRVNLIKSGKQWLGEEFTNNGNKLNYIFSFNTPDISKSQPNNLRVYSEVVARSDANSEFVFTINDDDHSSFTVGCSGVTLSSNTERYADDRKVNFKSSDYSQITNLSIRYQPHTNSSVGWLNLISINTKNDLIYKNGAFTFRDPDVVEDGVRTKFKMSGVEGKSIEIWDITDVNNPQRISAIKSTDTLSFIIDKSRFQEFLAFETQAAYRSPNYIGSVGNQNLHATHQAEYVIVTPNEFLNEATLLADIHRTYNSIDPVVIPLEQLYNEFSSGKQDPVAIRSFMRMLYSRSAVDNVAPKYLLLYGDGSYDNLGVVSGNKSKIVTYQSDKSFHQTESYVSDDFFGFLDDSEGNSETFDKLDIGIGRFVVNNIEEAKIANDKVKAYLTASDKSNWQSRITFLAQDGDDNLHQKDADDLANYVSANNPEFNLNKIYADAYPKVINSQTGAYPEADKAINNALNIDGTLIFNYTGHGAVQFIAYNFLTISKIQNLSNIGRLPLFLTATCEISRYDNPEEKSMGEYVFLNPYGGGIGLLSTTRVVYSFYNKNLNLNFYKNAFLKDEDNMPIRIGDIVKLTKNGSISSVNKLNFTLLCDPALRLNYPTDGCGVDSITDVRKFHVIDGVKLFQKIDTIQGLTHGVLSGRVNSKNGSLNQSYSGKADVAIYDKISTVTTRGNGGQKPFVYQDYTSVLYKGTVNVTDGVFKSEFVIPSDIRYDFGNGRITLFGSSDSGSAFGYNNGYNIGGLDPNAEYDGEAPLLAVYLNSKSFVDGSKCGPTPLFIGRVSDEQGINTAGAGIGHDLLLTIDGDPYKAFVLNNSFAFDLGSYQSGEVRYQISQLTPGMHSLSFKVWDCNNNSTTKSLTFEVVDDGTLQINDLLMYPNPVKENGFLSIAFTHDEPNSNFDITMEVYSMDGRLLDRSFYKRADINGSIPAIEWAPRLNSGCRLEAGVYVCRLWVTSSNGQNSNFSKRFVVIR